MKQPIALVAAMQEEVDALLAAFPQHDAHTHFHTRLYRARHDDQDVVIAQTGVGKVNAACTLTLLLSDFDPACVINTGSAGGLQPHQRILDFVVPEAIVYTDVDITPLGLTYGQMMGCEPRFKTSPELLALFRAVAAEDPARPVCHHGLLGSSDAMICSTAQVNAIRARFNGEVQCVDMEGGAIAQACTRFGVPYLVLRTLSDTPCKGDNVVDFQNFLAQASQTSAELCFRLVRQLSQMKALS